MNIAQRLKLVSNESTTTKRVRVLLIIHTFRFHNSKLGGITMQHFCLWGSYVLKRIAPIEACFAFEGLAQIH